MANTITFRQGLKSALPVTGLTLGEPLYVTDDKLLYVATSSSASIPVGAEIDASPSLGTSHIKLATQGAIKDYVDSATIEGLDLKDSCDCASTENDLGCTGGMALTTAVLTTTAAIDGAISSKLVFRVDTIASGDGTIQIGDVMTYSGSSGTITVASIAGDNDITVTSSGGALTLADDLALIFTKPVGPGQYLTAGSNEAITVDAIVLTLNMRVLMKDQTAAEENGIWKVTQVGTGSAPLILTRTDDFNIKTAQGNYKGVIQTNAYTMVGGGTVAAETGWAVSALGGSFIIGTDTAGDITWTQFNGTHSITDGTNLTKVGNILNVDDAFLVNNASDTTSGTITAAGFTTTGTWTMDTSAGGTTGLTEINVTDSFTDSDTVIMSAGAIKEKIEDYGYTTAGDSEVVDDTSPQLGGFLDPNDNYIGMEIGTAVASATPLVLTGATVGLDGDYFSITGTTGFSAMTVAVNRHFFLEFAGALTMTHGTGTLDLPGGANILTVAGDVAECVSTAANVVTVVNYTRAAGIKNAEIGASAAIATSKLADATQIGYLNLTGNITTGGTVDFTGGYTTALTVTGNTAITLPTTGTLVGTTATQTLTNKTLTTPIIASLYVDDSGSTMTFPNVASDTVCVLAATQTLTNKTIAGGAF